MTLEQHLILRKEFADKPDIWAGYIGQVKDVFDSVTVLKIKLLL